MNGAHRNHRFDKFSGKWTANRWQLHHGTSHLVEWICNVSRYGSWSWLCHTVHFHHHFSTSTKRAKESNKIWWTVLQVEYASKCSTAKSDCVRLRKRTNAGAIKSSHFTYIVRIQLRSDTCGDCLAASSSPPKLTNSWRARHLIATFYFLIFYFV